MKTLLTVSVLIYSLLFFGCALGDRLAVGLRTLTPPTKVRI